MKHTIGELESIVVLDRILSALSSISQCASLRSSKIPKFMIENVGKRWLFKKPSLPQWSEVGSRLLTTNSDSVCETSVIHVRRNVHVREPLIPLTFKYFIDLKR